MNSVEVFKGECTMLCIFKNCRGVRNGCSLGSTAEGTKRKKQFYRKNWRNAEPNGEEIGLLGVTSI